MLLQPNWEEGWPPSSPLHPQLKESRGGWTSTLLQLLSSCQHNTKQLPPSEPPVTTPNPLLLVTPGSDLPHLPVPGILSSPEYSELHHQPTSTITPLPYPGLPSSFSMCSNLSVLKETLPQPHSSLVTYFFLPSRACGRTECPLSPHAACTSGPLPLFSPHCSLASTPPLQKPTLTGPYPPHTQDAGGRTAHQSHHRLNPSLSSMNFQPKMETEKSNSVKTKHG